MFDLSDVEFVEVFQIIQLTSSLTFDAACHTASNFAAACPSRNTVWLLVGLPISGCISTSYKCHNVVLCHAVLTLQ